jgi:hypothetical protein
METPRTAEGERARENVLAFILRAAKLVGFEND